MSNGEDKKQLRTLIEQFLTRAEEIKAIFAQQQELLQYYQQQRNSVDLTASSLQQLQLDITSANNNSHSISNNSDVGSAVQQLEAIQVPADPPKNRVIGRLARTSVALPGTSQSMTPVNGTSGTAQSMTPVNVTPSNNSALPGQMTGLSHNSPYSPPNTYAANNNFNNTANTSFNNTTTNSFNNTANNTFNNTANNSFNNTTTNSFNSPVSPSLHTAPNSSAPNTNTGYNNSSMSSTNPWASAVHSPQNYANVHQPNSPYTNTTSAAYNTNSAQQTYNPNAYNNPTSPYSPSTPYTAANHYTSPYNSNSGTYVTPSSPYTAPYTSPRSSQHYPSPLTGSYSPAPYTNTPYASNVYPHTPGARDQYGQPYPQLYPYNDVQSQYHSAQPYSPHSAAQPYYDSRQSYNMQHSAYPDSCYTPQPSNPWGNYTASCDPCDPCTVNYQSMPPMSVSMTPVNTTPVNVSSQVQYSPVMSHTAVQSWPQHYTTQFTDLNQFINTNNLAAAVPQPDKDREKIILYFVSKGFQRQHVESSYDYLRKMNLQVNADFVEILKDALLVYPTTGTAGTTSGTATPAPSALPSNLLSEVNTLPRPQWVSDDKAPQCKICAAPFTLLFRRHHCRGCGNVVCALCSDKEVPLPKYVVVQQCC